ncbi:hypothetical protein PSAB6_180013 [Paraburkholderia sabiae]|nr:hypothetical protein PSAB6_180013 [Paraburkholderia sabiae]
MCLRVCLSGRSEVFLSATLVAMLWFLLFLFLSGIRDFVLVLQALPLCGAAPTFLCSGKEK